jgi:hypothetical protein
MLCLIETLGYPAPIAETLGDLQAQLPDEILFGRRSRRDPQFGACGDSWTVRARLERRIDL